MSVAALITIAVLLGTFGRNYFRRKNQLAMVAIFLDNVESYKEDFGDDWYSELDAYILRGFHGSDPFNGHYKQYALETQLDKLGSEGAMIAEAYNLGYKIKRIHWLDL